MSIFYPLRYLGCLLAAGVLLAAQTQSAQARSAQTEPVKGRAPTATPTITGTLEVSGELTVDLGFKDDDDDDEKGSEVYWFSSGKPIGNGPMLTLELNQPGIGGDLLTVSVTPRTDPSITEPSVGNAVQSAERRVGAGPIFARFITPLDQELSWDSADKYCKGLGDGARLPTTSELQQLFVDATRSSAVSPNAGYIVNMDMCSEHGWPLHNQCGNSDYATYWASNPLNNGYAMVYLDSGKISFNVPNNFNTRKVACIR